MHLLGCTWGQAQELQTTPQVPRGVPAHRRLAALSSCPAPLPTSGSGPSTCPRVGLPRGSWTGRSLPAHLPLPSLTGPTRLLARPGVFLPLLPASAWSALTLGCSGSPANTLPPQTRPLEDVPPGSPFDQFTRSADPPQTLVRALALAR